MNKVYIAGGYPDYLEHRSNADWEKHKYLKKEMKNGRWVYYYRDADTGKIKSEKEELIESIKRKNPKVTKKISETKAKLKKAFGLDDPKDRYKDEGYELVEEQYPVKSKTNLGETYDKTKKKTYIYEKTKNNKVNVSIDKGVISISGMTDIRKSKESGAAWLKRRLGVWTKGFRNSTGITAKKNKDKAKSKAETSLIENEQTKKDSKKKFNESKSVIKKAQAIGEYQQSENNKKKSLDEYHKAVEEYGKTPLGKVENAINKGKNWVKNLFKKKGS